jgi:hypothetical protein
MDLSKQSSQMIALYTLPSKFDGYVERIDMYDAEAKV